MASMKTTLELPDELMRAIKVRAAQQDRKIKDVVTELLRRALSQPESAATVAAPFPGTALAGRPPRRQRRCAQTRPAGAPRDEMRRTVDQSWAMFTWSFISGRCRERAPWPVLRENETDPCATPSFATTTKP